MTEKQRLKHEADNANRPTHVPHLDMADVIEPKTPPRLSWLNAKTHAGFAGRKNQPGRKPEQIAATVDFFAVKEKYDTGKDLPGHQSEVPIVAAGTSQA